MKILLLDLGKEVAQSLIWGQDFFFPISKQKKQTPAKPNIKIVQDSNKLYLREIKVISLTTLLPKKLIF